MADSSESPAVMHLGDSGKDAQHRVRISNVDNKKHLGIRRLRGRDSAWFGQTLVCQMPKPKCYFSLTVPLKTVRTP